MKNLLLVIGITILFSSCYHRIGDLTYMANRNVNPSAEYVLIERNVTGVAKAKKKDALERAIDKATESVDGEYMMNVKVYVKGNGRKIKIEGDVWGFKPAE